MKFVPLMALTLAVVSVSACGGNSPQVENAKAAAERKAAAEHFGNSQYTKIEPLRAADDKKPKGDAKTPDKKPQ